MQRRQEAEARIGGALTTVVRHGRKPRLIEYVAQRADVQLDRPLYSTLSRIAELGSATLSVLAEHEGLDASTLSRQARRLEQLGLVERSSDPHDGRVALLSLSSEGARVFGELQRAIVAFVAELLEDWSEEDVDGFASRFEQFAVAMAVLDRRLASTP